MKLLKKIPTKQSIFKSIYKDLLIRLLTLTSKKLNTRTIFWAYVYSAKRKKRAVAQFRNWRRERDTRRERGTQGKRGFQSPFSRFLLALLWETQSKGEFLLAKGNVNKLTGSLNEILKSQRFNLEKEVVMAVLYGKL